MSLTTQSYYVQDIHIPTGTYATLTEAITRYERDILIQLFGYDLAALILDYNSGTSPQSIKDIVEGKTYSEGVYTVKWNGLLNSEKVSILSYFVYIQHLNDKAMNFQNVGATVSDVEAGQIVHPAALMRKIGYRLRELAGYPGNDMYAPSLYNFMMKHQSDYPTWIFEEYVPINEFGI